MIYQHLMVLSSFSARSKDRLSSRNKLLRIDQRGNNSGARGWVEVKNAITICESVALFPHLYTSFRTQQHEQGTFLRADATHWYKIPRLVLGLHAQRTLNNRP